MYIRYVCRRARSEKFQKRANVFGLVFTCVFFTSLDWIGARKFCRLGTEGTPERGSGDITPGENFLKQSTIFALILFHFLSMQVQFYFMTKPTRNKTFAFYILSLLFLASSEIASFSFVLQN